MGICFNGKGWNHDFDLLAGTGTHSTAHTFDDALALTAANKWVFCHLSYDLKNQLEKLTSDNPDSIGFPELFFFEPKFLFQLKDDQLSVLTPGESGVDVLIQEIESIPEKGITKIGVPNHRISHERYLSDVTQLQNHMQLGNIYQANYCHEFYWDDVSISTSSLYSEGFKAMPNPFSVFYKLNEHHCVSFSPERFLQIKDDEIISQPMKGTAPRSDDPNKDLQNLEELKNSEKDRRENVMIVDLVRNDLSHYAKKGSVDVPELYQVETYPKVHQMYSTVRAKLRDDIHPLHAILKAFPIGSMTGAPKIKAMELLEKYEHSKRGLFSGTIGYFTPDGKADFNVIIRGLLYNDSTKRLSCHAGGRITALSDPEAEYEETFIKARPIFDLIK